MKLFRHSAALIAAALLAASAAYADVKISDLPAGTTLGGTEPIPAVQAGATVKVTPAQVNTYVQTQTTSATVVGKFSGTCNANTYLNGAGACAQVQGPQMGGTLPAAHGGTDQATAPDDNVLVGQGVQYQLKALPACAGATNALAYDTATNTFSCNTIAGGGGTPGGATTNIQFNNAGAFGGDADFVWDQTTNILTVGSSGTPGAVVAPTGAVALTLRGGTGSSSNGGALNLSGGTGSAANTGGALNINGGQGGTTSGAGNYATVTGGTGGTPNGNSGGVELVGGSPQGTGTIGDIRFSMPSTATQAGQLLIRDTSGDNILTLARSPATASYTGVSLTANGQKGASAGLNFTIAGGSSSSAPGALNLNGGACTGATCVGGNINLTAGTGVGTNQTGGSINMNGGTSTGNVAGGAISLGGGFASGTGVGGGVTLSGGTGNATGAGGTATVVGGAGGTTGISGGVSIRSGPTIDGSTGSVSIQSAAASGTNRNTGSVSISTGAPTGSGSAGPIILAPGGNSTITMDGATAAVQFNRAVAFGGIAGSAPTTGFNITPTTDINYVVIGPAGTLATGTLTLPASPIQGREICMTTTQTVTTLTVAGNGNTVFGAPTTITAATPFCMLYSGGVPNGWMRTR